MNLRDFRILVRERYRIIVATLLATVLATLVVSLVMPKSYEAQATLIVGNSTGTLTPTLDQTLLSQRLSQTYAAVATQRATIVRVIKSLGLDADPDQLLKRVSATAPTDSSLVQITVSAAKPNEAAEVANAVARDIIQTTPSMTGRDPETQAFISKSLSDAQTQIGDTESQIAALNAKPSLTGQEQLQLASLQQRLSTLQSTYAQLLSLASTASSNIATLSDPAVPPSKPASPNVPLNLLLAVIAGLLIGLALAAAADHLDDSVKSSDDVETLAALPTLASIGRQRTDRGTEAYYLLATLMYPRSAIAEAYRVLRTNVGFASVDRRVQLVLVTSAKAGEGKTTVAANLAVAFAQDGKSVIAVDADLRRPGLHGLFRAPGMPGLTNLLRDGTVQPGRLLIETEEPGLRLLPAGDIPPNPAELMGSHRMTAILDSLRALADIVVIDSAPLDLVTDTALLAKDVDGAIVVVSAGRTPRASLRDGVERLRRGGGVVLGVVLNRDPAAAASVYPAYEARSDAGPVGSAAGRPARS